MSSGSPVRDRPEGYSGRGRRKETERKRKRKGGGDEAEEDAGRENRVIYRKQYYRRHAEGAEEWEKPVSLVPEMYFIATEDGGSRYNGDPAYYSLSGRHWI